MKMIAVLEWADGFGNDSAVMGIFDSVEAAQKVFAPYPENDSYHKTRFINIKMNEKIYFDNEDGEPLFPKKKKKRA